MSVPPSSTAFAPFRRGVLRGLIGLAMLASAAGTASAACGPLPADTAAISPVPYERDGAERRFARQMSALRGSDAETLLVGDSIIARWSQAASDLGRPVANFGVSGDRTENVLYRLDRADLAPGRFRRVVLMVGTNNLRRDDACAIFGGISAIVRRLHERLPQAAVLVVSVLPRGTRLGTRRPVIEQLDRLLSEGQGTLDFTYVDAIRPFAAACAEAEPCALLADGLHPNAEGYALLARSLRPALEARAGR